MTHFRVIMIFLVVPLAAFAVALSEPRVKPPMAAGGICDMQGRGVPVVAPAHHVVVFPPILPVYLAVDGTPDHIRAATQYQVKEIRNGLLRSVFPAAANLPVAATSGRDTAIPGDPEQVLLLGADAVFSWAHFSANLKKIGAPLVQLEISSTHRERDIEAMWRLVGAVAGRSARVEWLISRFRQGRDRVLSAVAGQNGHPRALYIYRTDPLLVAFAGTREAELLEEAGAVNVASGLHNSHVTKEQLLEFAPDVIIVAGYEDGNTVQALCHDPAFKGLPAVRTRRVYRQPTGSAHMDGLVDEPLMLQWLAELMHPDTMPRRFRQDIRDTYADIYGVTLSDDAIDETLRLDENSGSAGFGRFLRPTCHITHERSRNRAS